MEMNALEMFSYSSCRGKSKLVMRLSKIIHLLDEAIVRFCEMVFCPGCTCGSELPTEGSDRLEKTTQKLIRKNQQGKFSRNATK